MDTKVTIKSRGNGEAVVTGYGVVFGGEDLYGETFSKDTDFMLSLVPEKPVLFNHGLPVRIKQGDKSTEFSLKSFLGAVKSSSIFADDKGLFIEAVLDESADYMKEILDLIEQGVIGWSSGSIGHLVQREGKNIRTWPIVEFSLTHTPAEPRTLGVEHLRALEAVGLEASDTLEEVEAETESVSELVKITYDTIGVTDD